MRTVKEDGFIFCKDGSIPNQKIGPGKLVNFYDVEQK